LGDVYTVKSNFVTTDKIRTQATQFVSYVPNIICQITWLLKHLLVKRNTA